MESVLNRSSIIEMADCTGADVRDLDAQLMLRFQDGDTGAFDTLFHKHMTRIVNFAYRFVRNREIAEELAQEVFLKVYESAEGYRVQAKFTSWLYRIATNICLNELRKPQFRVKHQSLYSEQDDSTGEEEIKLAAIHKDEPDRMLERKAIERVIKSGLAQIPENQRVAFVLNKYEELSYAEVADILKISEKAVKSLIHRAKEALAERLKPFMQELLSK
ncbi:MAG: sigma-70 family RNA polymerase sigma factor [Acidobacteriota bacterium]